MVVNLKSKLKNKREVSGDKPILRDIAMLYQYASVLPVFYAIEMKRFTETTKWDDPWFRKLSCKHKAFWQFICDKCDNAGVWKIDYELASFQLGEEITEKDIDAINNGKERVVIQGDNLIIKEFIPFQIGNLSGDNLTNLQKNCVSLLETYKNKEIDLTGKDGVSYPKGSGISKGKGKGVGKGKDKSNNKFIPPTLEEVKQYIETKKYNVDAKKFFDFFNDGDWIDSKGNPVKSWKQKVITWSSNSKGVKNGRIYGRDKEDHRKELDSIGEEV